jgi:hypothetical protein
MKGQKKENSLETIEIHPNQKLYDRAMLFYKFIADDS